MALAFVPYIKPDLLHSLGVLVYAFPAVAGILSVIAAWRLWAENVRLEQVGKQYRNMLGQYAPPRTASWHAIPNLGKAISLVFLVGLLLFAGLNSYMLGTLLERGSSLAVTHPSESAHGEGPASPPVLPVSPRNPGSGSR